MKPTLHTIINIFSRRFRVWAVGLVVLLCIAPAAVADETLIVLSSNAKPYVQAAIECETVLHRSGIETRRVLLTDLNDVQIKEARNAVIAVGGRASAKLSHELPETVRLYYCMAPSPGKIGLTNRANSAGVSTETDLKGQVELIGDSSRSIKKVGALYRSNSQASVVSLDAMRDAIPSGWELIAIDLDSAQSEASGIKKLLKSDIDIVWTVPDPSVYNSATIKMLLLESLRKEVPVFGFSQALVRAGATFGIGIDPGEQGQYAAELLIKQETDVHVPASPLIVINLIVAERIRFKIPEALHQRADAIFQAD